MTQHKSVATSNIVLWTDPYVMVMRQTADHVNARLKTVCCTMQNHVITPCTACDVKYKTAKSFFNRYPMFMTAQQKLQFKEEDQQGMDRRLRYYFFKRLSSPKKKATQWLRKHRIPMDGTPKRRKNISVFKKKRIREEEP